MSTTHKDETSRTTRTPPKTRPKRGSLAQMPHMPLDILIDIMAHLEPQDLLSLARTTRAFRSFLMTRPAAPLWRRARANVPGAFPACPADLSEPAYANLAFDMHCHACGQPGTKTVLWGLRVRLCRGCRSVNLVECAGNCDSSYTKPGQVVLPYSKPPQGYRHWHLAAQLRDMKDTIDTLTEEEIGMTAQQTYAILQHAKECEAWHDAALSARWHAREATRQRRLDDIVERLRDQGWGTELDGMAPCYTALRRLPEVTDARELTERAWERIEPLAVAQLCELHASAAMESARARPARRVPGRLGLMQLRHLTTQ